MQGQYLINPQESNTIHKIHLKGGRDHWWALHVWFAIQSHALHKNIVLNNMSLHILGIRGNFYRFIFPLGVYPHECFTLV